MKRLAPLIICAPLAAACFVYARHRYVSSHSLTLTNPFKSSEHTRVTSPLADDDYFGEWVKTEWVFALLIPAGLLGAGLARTLKR
ncbi:MAG: hypothetical protein RI897_243 [Verrucomicrobiota bacterium]|jgi:hypothetical protein